MAKFRQIQTNFWSNPYIQEEMTAEDKYFYLYLMTNEFTTQIGIYPITKKQIAFDLGYSMESVEALLQRFETYHKLIKYDTETREIILLKWAEDNLNVGGKPVQDLIAKEISQVKNKDFLFLMYENCPDNSLKTFIASLLQQIKKDSNINASYDTSDDSYDVSCDDAGAITNKEEIINNKEEIITTTLNNNIYNIEQNTILENSSSSLRQELKLLLKNRKINIEDLIKLNKPITRIKEVIQFCDANNKGDGWLFKALKEDWSIYKTTEKSNKKAIHEKDYTQGWATTQESGYKSTWKFYDDDEEEIA